MEKDAPSVKKDAPSVEKDAPSVEKDAPSVEKDAPSVEKDAPSDKKDAFSDKIAVRSREWNRTNKKISARHIHGDICSGETGCSGRHSDFLHRSFFAFLLRSGETALQVAVNFLCAGNALHSSHSNGVVAYKHSLKRFAARYHHGVVYVVLKVCTCLHSFFSYL
jgi:hypothetical protein